MLTLVLAAALAQTPSHWLFRQPNLPTSASAFFEFAPASGAGMGSACGEGQSNYLQQSAALDASPWASFSGGGPTITVTANAGTAPDGSATAERIQITAASGAGQYALRRQVASPAILIETTFTASVYLRGVSGSGTIWLYNSASGAGTGAPITACAYTTEWSRCSVTFRPASAADGVDLGVNTYFASVPSSAAIDVYAWGAQIELGPSVGTYNATTSAAYSSWQPTGSRGEAVTTSRASTAYCTRSDYQLVSLPANAARVMTGGTGLPLGLAYEFSAATNNALYARDLSQAAWAKTSMTCARTATGADGAPLSGSVCTASGSNATVTQTVVQTGAQAASLYLKRRTGTGTVSVTVDGSTWVDVTSTLSSTVFKRVVNTEAVGCAWGGCVVVRALTATFGASVVLGVRLGTSGDAVDVDFAQVEAGSFPTSPIYTAAAGATRAAETHSATVAAFSPGSMSMALAVTGSRDTYGIASSAQRDANNEFFYAHAVAYGSSYAGLSPFCFSVNGGAYESNYSSEVAPTVGPVYVACSNDGTTLSTTVAGWTTSKAATIQPATGVVTVWLGGRTGGSNGGVLSRYCLDPSPTRCTAASNLAPNSVAWIGDSISAGSVSAPTLPPSELQALIGRPVWNKGLPADNVAGCHSRFTGRVLGKGSYTALVYAAGTNDCIAGTTAVGHATWTMSLSTLTAATSAGMGVVVANILPEKKAAAWTTSIQDCIDAYNSDWAAWCAANASSTVKCVDSYAAFGGGTGGVCSGADPACLLNAYDSGDGRHPNAAGSAFFAALVADAGVP